MPVYQQYSDMLVESGRFFHAANKIFDFVDFLYAPVLCMNKFFLISSPDSADFIHFRFFWIDHFLLDNESNDGILLIEPIMTINDLL